MIVENGTVYIERCEQVPAMTFRKCVVVPMFEIGDYTSTLMADIAEAGYENAAFIECSFCSTEFHSAMAADALLRKVTSKEGHA